MRHLVRDVSRVLTLFLASPQAWPKIRGGGKFRCLGGLPLWCLDKTRTGLAITLPLEVFTRRNFAAGFFRQKLKFTGKNSKFAFCATLCFLGDLGVTYTVHRPMARWKARGPLPN